MSANDALRLFEFPPNGLSSIKEPGAAAIPFWMLLRVWQ